MQVMTSLQAKNHFGELMDRSQREPVVITKRGRPFSFMFTIPYDDRSFAEAIKFLAQNRPIRGIEATAALKEVLEPFHAQLKAEGLDDLTEEDIARMLKDD